MSANDGDNDYPLVIEVPYQRAHEPDPPPEPEGDDANDVARLLGRVALLRLDANRVTHH